MRPSALNFSCERISLWCSENLISCVAQLDMLCKWQSCDAALCQRGPLVTVCTLSPLCSLINNRKHLLLNSVCCRPRLRRKLNKTSLKICQSQSGAEASLSAGASSLGWWWKEKLNVIQRENMILCSVFGAILFTSVWQPSFLHVTSVKPHKLSANLLFCYSNYIF